MSELAKGAATRDTVLDTAVVIAGRIGLSGLTIGMLATATGMSKSGLFAHFGSKETLQLQVLARARDEFTDRVVRPALRAPRGEARVRALFEHWVAVIGDPGAPCLFPSAGMEYDDQPGVVRDQVVRDHTDFAEAVQQIFRTGISEGDFRADADAVQFEHDLGGIMLGCFHSYRLLGEADAEARARSAFERLIAGVKA
ncbi:MAG TPA: TetR/AcrR family transcriptional regulator [Streptosporangiaceae bacterium]|nr:TetR/AcrR family transcriptional regulator [Streptosporangiaceae bacterium]